MSRSCINCGQPIRKKTITIRFDTPRAFRPAGHLSEVMGHKIGYDPGTKEKPEGHREEDSHGNWVIYTTTPPKTKAEAQRYSNHPIVSIRRWKDTISQFSVWDGESYDDAYFHNGRCAQEYGYKAARAGVRL
jgi:hypothetical protein